MINVAKVFDNIHNSRRERDTKKVIINNFDVLMMSVADSKSGNKLEYKYKIQELFFKHYGFDAIVSIPTGKNLADFRLLIPSISVLYKANVIAEYSSNMDCIYMRCHLNGLDIKHVNSIKFDWYMFFSDKKYRTSNGDTFSLHTRTPIYHPVEKVVNPKTNKEERKVIGHRFKVKIPSGLSYDTLEDCIADLNKKFGICSLEYIDGEKQTYIEIIEKKLPDNDRFKPIPVKPWELLVGYTHSYQPIVLNFKDFPNALIGGASGSGKTYSLLTGLINLLYSCDKSQVNLYLAMLSDKPDFKCFKRCEITKFYADTPKDSVLQLKSLIRMIKERNKLFDSYGDEDDIINTIYDYNKVAEKKLPLIYYIVDEVACFGEKSFVVNMNGHTYTSADCREMMWEVARLGRSAGIYTILCTQRGTVANINPEAKGNLSNCVCFSFPNTASALTILGDGDLVSLAVKQRKNREFICCGDKTYFGKTLYLDNIMIKEYTKPFRTRVVYESVEDDDGNFIEMKVLGEEKPTEKKENNTDKTTKDNAKPNSNVNKWANKWKGKKGNEVK